MNIRSNISLLIHHNVFDKRFKNDTHIAKKTRGKSEVNTLIIIIININIIIIKHAYNDGKL